MPSVSSRTLPRMSSTNINFLLGSGVSRPLLSTLTNIERLLDEAATEPGLAALIRHEFFLECIAPARQALHPAPTSAALETLQSLENFFRTLQALLFRRDSATEGMRARVFTTNYDPLCELALERIGADYEDGFAGRMDPRFDVGNYGSIRFLRSQHFGMNRESPTIDLHKLHGSTTWFRKRDGSLGLDRTLRTVRKVTECLEKSPLDRFPGGIANRTLDDLKEAYEELGPQETEPFATAYAKLQIVNPSRAKYASTVLEQVYYDQLRTLANELERTNTSLFAIGFSFEDSHVRGLVLRALDLNPTLAVTVFAYDRAAVNRLNELLAPGERRNRNLEVLEPEKTPSEDGSVDVPWTISTVTERALAPNVTLGSR